MKALLFISLFLVFPFTIGVGSEHVGLSPLYAIITGVLYSLIALPLFHWLTTD